MVKVVPSIILEDLNVLNLLALCPSDPSGHKPKQARVLKASKGQAGSISPADQMLKLWG